MTTNELSFDPATPDEWAALTTLGHRMLDEMMAHLATLDAKPAWQPMPPEVADSFGDAPPRTGSGADDAYRQFVARVLPYPNGNLHPRFFGWVQGNGTPLAMLAEMLAAGLNANVGGFNHAPVLIEKQVVRWFAELFGIPQASGLLVTGGSMANTLGLAVARYAHGARSGRDFRRDGMQHWPGDVPARPLTFYGSTETHSWATKAADWLGLGARAFRRVPVDAAFRLDLDALASLVAADRAAGFEPFCVMGTAGTVNTGASDDLEAIATFCERESLWFHVDGAFGALAWLSPALRPQVAGMDRADSLGFDLHKWGSMPYECACTLIRDPELHHAAFRTSASYLAPASRGLSVGGTYFAERGIDLTRGFKALKVWMTLHAEGTDKLARIIEQNVAHVQMLVARIEAHAELELLAPAPLNIACFRYVPPSPAGASRDDEALDRLNAELLVRLQERGLAVPSSTIIGGRFALRVAHVNHRTRRRDIDALVEHVVAIGRELVDEMRAGS